jgi:hypothetical protein
LSAAAALPCLACGAPLGEAAVSALVLSPCGACGLAQRYELFPAWEAPPPSSSGGEAVVSAEEASCAFHPGKKAVVSCARCGLFVCSLCELEVSGERICPRCLETGVKKGKLKDLENHRFLYDRLALMLAVYPAVLFYPTLLTAPVALFVALRFWNAPRSLVKPGRGAQIWAVVLALLEMAGWVLLVIGLFAVLSRKRR